MKKPLFTGSGVAIVTPFTKETVDLPTLGKLLDFQMKNGTVAIIVCGRPDCQEGICEGFWPQDCGAAIENLLLQAPELGYGTCWCGCYPVMKRSEALQKILDVTSIPLAVFAVGKADEAPKARGFYDSSRVKWIL